MFNTNLVFRRTILTNINLTRQLKSNVDRLRSLNFVDVKCLDSVEKYGSKKLRLRGWIDSTVKSFKKLTFFRLSDGMSTGTLQVVMSRDLENSLEHNLTYGTSVICTGELIASKGKQQAVEFKCDTIEFAGETELFPFHNKEESDYWDNIRQHPHLRFKSQHFSSLQRVRSKLLVQIHDYLQNKGYLNVMTPIITRNDCEGGGEAFCTIANQPKEQIGAKLGSNSILAASSTQLSKQSIEIEEETIKATTQINEPLTEENEKFEENSSQATRRFYPKKSTWDDYNLSSREILEKFILPSQSEIDNVTSREEFFGNPTYLTVSGQLHLEAVSLGVNRVYTLSPCFRSESSISRKHLSEFVMLELEECYLDSLNILMDNVEALCKDLVRSLLSEYREEINLILSKNRKPFLDSIITNDYERITYEDALKLINEKSKLPELNYGSNFNTTYETFLIEYFNNTPIFITHFPSFIKPFYMKTQYDKALNFDLIYPVCGEVAGGSLREDDLERMEKLFQIYNLKDLEWYKNLRKEGSIPHGGFGLGVDRFIQAILRMPNIRDVVPFPRWAHHCPL